MGPFPYTDFRRTSCLLRCHHTNAEWMARATTFAVVCPLIFVVGFSILRCFFDCMHTFDLGVLQVAIPSAMRDLAGECVWRGGRALKMQMEGAYREYRNWRRRTKVPCQIRQKFKPTSWFKSGYPRISQVTAKAAALRSMLYWVAEECVKHARTSHGRLRAACFACLRDFDAICKNAGRHMTDEEHEEMSQAIENALLAYNALADTALRKGIRRWKVLPKMHALTHYWCSKTNPRAVHCYLDEDFVGRLKRIVNSVHGKGTGTSKRAMIKYKIGVCLRWWDMQKTLRCIPVVYRKRDGTAVVEKSNADLRRVINNKVKHKN